MNALKILIIEDNLLLAEELQEQLIDFGYIITDTVANSTDAQRAFRRKLPDLVLCDIHLEGSELDGIQLVEQLNKMAKIPIIFLTAFSDKATIEKAKAVHPAYYLIKPCNSTQLKIAIDFAILNFSTKKEAEVQHSLQFHATPNTSFYASSDFFFVKTGHKYIRIEVADIIYVEALGTNVKIITNTGTAVLSANLSNFLEQTPHPTLKRVHRSYVINIQHIRAFNKGQIFVMIDKQQHEIPVGKTYREEFQEAMPRLFSQ
jgi:DNA-binding LytR/AlgR family response regulator